MDNEKSGAKATRKGASQLALSKALDNLCGIVTQRFAIFSPQSGRMIIGSIGAQAMHTTIDYSLSPAKAFDAVEDIKDYLGIDKWNEVNPLMSEIKDQEQFTNYCGLAGISGFPVKAWYELINGQGSWKE